MSFLCKKRNTSKIASVLLENNQRHGNKTIYRTYTVSYKIFSQNNPRWFDGAQSGNRGSPNNSDIRRRFMWELEEEIAGEKIENMPIAVEIGVPDIGREEAIIDGDRLSLSCCTGHNAVARLFENSFLARYQTILYRFFLSSFARSSSSRDNVPAITKRGEYNKLRNNDLSKTVRSLYPCKRVIV